MEAVGDDAIVLLDGSRESGRGWNRSGRRAVEAVRGDDAVLLVVVDGGWGREEGEREERTEEEQEEEGKEGERERSSSLSCSGP